MPATRRRLLEVALLVPVAGTVGVAAGTAIRALNRATRALRPAPAGTSATRCAACGGGHSMLDDACLRRPRVV